MKVIFTIKPVDQAERIRKTRRPVARPGQTFADRKKRSRKNACRRKGRQGNRRDF
jgi:hypothetical protein